MKKIFLALVLSCILFYAPYSFSQSGWYNTFFNNTSSISKIIQRDSLNYFAFCYYGKYYYRSSNAGNNWTSYKEYSLDSVLSIYDGVFVNPLTGWVVGTNTTSYRNEILKTTNGGNNWFEQITGDISWENRCLSFLNAHTGWVGGGAIDGKLYKTTNGGDNWIVQVFPNSGRLGSMKFYDANNAWIMGETAFLARTTNGGLTWIQKTINNVQPAMYTFYRGIFPINNNEAWALVVRNAGLIYSHLYKTTNGGDNWDLTYSYTDSLNTDAKSMWNINFVNFSTGFGMGGYSFIVKTTNTGNNWTRMDTHSDLGYSININTMFLSSNSEIFSSGGNSEFSHVLKSTNSGLNWSVKSRNTDYNFSQIEFVNNNTGFVITDSDSGRLYRTTNYGNNWDLSIGNSKYYFKKLSFANSSIGCVIGSPYAYANYNSKTLRTTDSGNNWSEINIPLYFSAFTIQFIDQQNGFIGCDSNRLLVTSNAGLNWNVVNLSHSIPFDIEGISFINNSTGWLSGHKTYSIYPNNFERNILWKTTNSGGNWNIIYDSIGIRRNYLIQFVTENTGFKTSNTGSKVYFKTINGGANWFSVSLPVYTDYWSFKFINQNTGWISGSTSTSNRVILKTTNGGNNWSFQLIEEYGSYIRSIYAFDENNAWFCGYNNSIYKTTDGGGVIGIEPVNNSLRKHFSLSQSYPNPFNPTTIINYQLSVSSNVSLKIYDITGKEISILVNQKQTPGYYKVKFDGSYLPSGVYFYKIFTEDFSETKKMILIK